jgi:hypothetical protein
LDPATEVDLWDVLFSRLAWPSPIVRERAAAQMSELLVNEEMRDTCLTGVCQWLSEQKLESKVIVGLLPVARAARMGPLGNAGLVQRLRLSIKAPSRVSDSILFDIEKHL